MGQFRDLEKGGTCPVIDFVRIRRSSTIVHDGCLFAIGIVRRVGVRANAVWREPCASESRFADCGEDGFSGAGCDARESCIFAKCVVRAGLVSRD